jgi:hypothetical protein
MKNKLFNWSIHRTKDGLLNKIKNGIGIHLSDGLMNQPLKKRIFRTLRHNLTLILIIAGLITTNLFSYYSGKDSKNEEIACLSLELQTLNDQLGIKSDMLDESELNAEDLKAEINRIKNSRLYMTSIVERDAGVEIPDRVEDDHLRLMFACADSNDIPYTVFFRVIQKESRYKWWVVSSAGAQGYMQMMPATYKSVAGKIGQPLEMTPESNIICGSYYLRKKYNEMFNKVIHKKVYDKLDFDMNTSVQNLSKEEFEVYSQECQKIKNDTSYYNNHNTYIWELALSAYNAGSSKVGYSVPNISETQGYVKFILNPYYEGI